MKKILLAINALLLVIIAFQACNSSSQKKEASSTTIRQEYFDDSIRLAQKVKIKEGLEGVYFEVTQFNGGIIDDEVANLMSKRYKADLRKSRMTNTGLMHSFPDDTRSIRFSLETLKKFIENIEKSTNNNNCNLATGITFYYGIYPGADEIQNYESLRSLDKNIVADRHTLFMVPSYFDVSRNVWVDFNYNEIGKDICHPTPYSVLMNDTVKYQPSILAFDKNKLTFPKGGNPELYIEINDALQNHGGMAPPPAGSGTFPSPNDNL